MNHFPAAPARRRYVAAAVALVAAAVSLLAVAGSAAATRDKPAPPARPDLPLREDRDGDKVFDELEDALAKTAGDATVPVIVSLAAPPTEARVKELEARAGGFAFGRRFTLIDAFSTQLRKGQVEALTHVPWVEHVELDAVIRASNGGAQQAFGVTAARADAPSLDGDGDGASGYSHADLVAAVIDTGIDASHVDLDGGKVLAFKDFVNGRTTAYDDNGHGTHVAATIAGDGDASGGRDAGVAPRAALVGVKVLDAAGSGSMSSIAAALDWVVANRGVYGIEVVNLSLGASGCADGTDAASQAVNAAAAAGLVVAVAAGNDGPGTCTVGSPAAAADAVTVGAMADFDAAGFSLASFSSRGPTADGRVKPDVVAPGVDVVSARANSGNGYVSYSGTSMATPFVAGVALLMRDANGALTPQQVKNAITSSAIDWGRAGDNRAAGGRGADADYGAGRLDAHAALKAAGVALGAGPAAPAHDLREGTLTATGAVVDYRLPVADTRFPIAATLIIPALKAATAWSPDFDLYLLDPAGRRVAAAETVERQELVAFKPTTAGTYTLRVASYSGTGDFFVDISAGLGTDTTAPTVTSVAPADGAGSVAATTNVGVTFSETMNATAAQGAFSLVDPSGAAVAGSFAWSGSTLVFDPSSNLAAGTRYTARVTTAAKDAAGNALAAEKAWSFTVAVETSKTTAAVPYTTSLYYGSVRSGDYTRLAADDDAYFAVNSTTWGSRVADWYGRVRGIPNALTGLRIVYSGRASATCSQSVYVYNWTTGAWVGIDGRSIGTTEVQVSASVGGTLADYVGGTSGDGDVAVRIRCTRSDGTSFFTSGDLLQVIPTS